MVLIKALINNILLIFIVIALLCNCRAEKKNDITNQKVADNQSKIIIFLEDFESSSIIEMQNNWDDRKHTEDMSFSKDVPEGSKGKQSLMMTYIPKKNKGGHLFKSLPNGYDTLYARFYVKFLTRNSKIHHLVKLGGYNPVTKYPQGFAGLKPNGQDFFISGIESPDNKEWSWGFYTYWMHMQGSNNKYWGNVFFPETLKKSLKENGFVSSL